MSNLDMSEVLSVEVVDRQITHDVVEDGRGHLNLIVSRYRSVRFEAHQREGFNEFFERNAVLQS